MPTIRFLRSVFVATGLCALALAQHAEVIQGAFGASKVEGGAWAGGPDYSARFDEQGVAFLPRHRGAGERAYPLRFRLESVVRGSDTVFLRTADRDPVVDGNRVTFPHRSDLVEVYDARRDGIEQSFVFATKPAGTGALVVRGAITTDLPLASASDECVLYELPGIAGVTFGAVTGLDANGATARGSIRVEADGSHVEWVLPAAFVENAKYPLVLDPLIGSVITIGNSANGPDRNLNVAFDDATNRYLVVWNDMLTGTNDEIRAQFVSASGTPVGSSFYVGLGHLTRRALANIAGTGRFLVTAYTHYWSGVTSSVRVRSIDAGNGAVSNSVDIELGSAGGSSVDLPVVGGDSRTLITSDSALLVYMRNGGLRSCIVNVPASGDPVIQQTSWNTLAASGNSPSVTAYGGNPLRWLVTWKENPTAFGPQYVWAAMVGSAGTPCAPPILLFTSAAGDVVHEPVCAAADGTTFLTAWRDTNGGAEILRGKVLSWWGACGGGTLTPGPLLALTPTAYRQISPALAFAKEKFLLAWRTEATATATMRVVVKGLDPLTCADCGSEWSVENTLLDNYSPAIASRFSAGDTSSDEALVVWSNDAVRARRCEARSNDVVTAMGGSCSASGFNDFATYNGDAVLGATDFELALASPVSLPLILVLGFGNLSAPCGSCTIVPTLDILQPAINPYPLAIPCDPLLVGVDLYTQWVLLKPSDCPILPDLAFSNALRFTIGE
jgi:hypothetical protein